ncbi:AMIN domain-containing protein [Microcoleus sp. F6_B4]
MPYKKLLTRFGEDLQKLTVNSLPAGLFAIESLSLSLAVAAAVATVPVAQHANASTLTSWHFDPATNELVITLPEGTAPKYSLLNPSQIAVDLPNTEIGIDATQLYPEGMVRSVGVSQIEGLKARIVVDLAPGFAVRADRTIFQKIGTANRWVLIPSIEPSSTGNTTQTQTQTPSATRVPQSRPVRTPNSVADREPVSPAPSATLTYDGNSSQPTTQNDQIRPITVPLVRVAVKERRGIPLAPVPRPAASKQRIITFGEPLPK